MKFNIGNYEINMVHHDPVVFTVDGILSNEECEHFQEVAKKNMRRSLLLNQELVTASTSIHFPEKKMSGSVVLKTANR